MIEEIWKPIEGFDGDYLISNYGRVRSLKRNGDRIMPLTKQHKGYYYVMLWDSSIQKGKCCRVHRLVARHFLANPDNLPSINHKDGNKANNYVSNLEWCSHSYNVKHSYDTGLKHPHRLTQDEINRLRESHIGKPLSAETREKIRQALKGKKRKRV